MNSIVLYRRVTKELELFINGLRCDITFTSDYYDGTTRSEIDDFLQSQTGIDMLSGNYQSPQDQTISYICEADDISFDGTDQYKINYIDELQP